MGEMDMIFVLMEVTIRWRFHASSSILIKRYLYESV